MNLTELVEHILEHPPNDPTDLPTEIDLEPRLGTKFSTYMLLSQQTNLEYGCALGLPDEEGHKLKLGTVKQGVTDGVSISEGDAPRTAAYVGTFHTHPRDETGAFMPHSGPDFLIFTNHVHCLISLVAAGSVASLSAVPDFYMLVRTKSSITGKLNTPKGNDWMEVAKQKAQGILNKNSGTGGGAHRRLTSTEISEAAFKTTKHLAKHLKFGFYRSQGSCKLKRL